MKNLIIVILIMGVIVAFSATTVEADPPFPLPRVPICGDGDDPNDPPVLHCTDLVPIADIQVFQVAGTGQVNQVFDFVFRAASYNNELVVYMVDDAIGTIGGVAPGDPSYLTEVFARSTVIFPSGSTVYTPDVTLPFSGGDYLVFFIVQNNTLANLLANNPTNDINGWPLAFFSIDSLAPDVTDHFVGFDSVSSTNTQFGFEDQTSGGDTDYDDVVFNVVPPLEPACPVGQWYGRYYDNRDLQGDPKLVRCDVDIDFYWGNKAPASNVPSDNFSARWEQTVEIAQSGTYRFRTFTDDGLRLYIDGVLKIDDWAAQAFEENSVIVPLTAGPHQIRMDYVEWSFEAMADLSWYKCPNGAGDCDLDITPDYQTRYLDDPMPEGCTDEPNQTLARWGCLITSHAMALQSLGVAIDPAQLNSLLSQQTGAYEGDCNSTLQSTDFVKDVVSDTFDIAVEWVSVNEISSAIAAVRNNHPVIMKHSGLGHFFLAVDVAEIDGTARLGVNDPHHAWVCKAESANPPLPVASILDCYVQSPTPILKHMASTTESLGGAVPIGYWRLAQQSHGPSLSINAKGAEMLLTDSEDRKVGYSNASSQFVFGIPNSSYHDSKIVPPGVEQDDTLMRNLFLTDDASGVFLLRVIGVGAGSRDGVSPFTIRFTGLDAQFSMIEAEISGLISDREIIEYMVRYEPGQMLTVRPVVNVFLPITLVP